MRFKSRMCAFPTKPTRFQPTGFIGGTRRIRRYAANVCNSHVITNPFQPTLIASPRFTSLPSVNAARCAIDVRRCSSKSFVGFIDFRRDLRFFTGHPPTPIHCPSAGARPGAALGSGDGHAAQMRVDGINDLARQRQVLLLCGPNLMEACDRLPRGLEDQRFAELCFGG